MSQTSQFTCDRCGNSIYNTVIDGVRLPIIVSTIVGQIPDSGPRVEVNARGVKLPSEVRALMDPALGTEARLDECIACYCEVRGIVPVEYDEARDLWLFERPEVPVETVRDLTKRDADAILKSNAFKALALGLGRSAPAVPSHAHPRRKEIHAAVLNLAQGAPIARGGGGSNGPA